jgi:DNA-directed RNA polymerase subunit RPC12/RpoP
LNNFAETLMQHPVCLAGRETSTGLVTDLQPPYDVNAELQTFVAAALHGADMPTDSTIEENTVTVGDVQTVGTDDGGVVISADGNVLLKYFEDAEGSDPRSYLEIGHFSDGQTVFLIPSDMPSDEAQAFILKHIEGAEVIESPMATASAATANADLLSALNVEDETISPYKVAERNEAVDSSGETFMAVQSSRDGGEEKGDSGGVIIKEIDSEPVVGMFACHLCTKTFRSPTLMNRHLKTHGSVKPYRCPYCDKRFTNSSNLKSHTRIHTKDKPYACRYCEKGFAQASNLKSHERTHTKDKRFACRYCGKRFARSSHVHGHMVVHTGSLRFSCADCAEMFSTAQQLKAHRACVHGIGESFTCVECEVKFASKFRYNKHMRSHAGDTPYVCRDCPRRFAFASLLRLHMVRHLDLKPYGCTVCTRRFASIYVAKKHMQQHIALL